MSAVLCIHTSTCHSLYGIDCDGHNYLPSLFGGEGSSVAPLYSVFSGTICYLKLGLFTYTNYNSFIFLGACLVCLCALQDHGCWNLKTANHMGTSFVPCDIEAILPSLEIQLLLVFIFKAQCIC